MTDEEVKEIRNEHHRILRNMVLYTAIFSATTGYIVGVLRTENRLSSNFKETSKIELLNKRDTFSFKP